MLAILEINLKWKETRHLLAEIPFPHRGENKKEFGEEK